MLPGHGVLAREIEPVGIHISVSVFIHPSVHLVIHPEHERERGRERKRDRERWGREGRRNGEIFILRYWLT